MALDALCIVGAGVVAGEQAPRATLPFVAVLSVDHSLTLASSALTDVAQNSVSSTALRGRIPGSYALLVIVGDMAAEALAVSAEESWGIPGLLLRAGMFQAVVVSILCVWWAKVVALRTPTLASSGRASRTVVASLRATHQCFGGDSDSSMGWWYSTRSCL